jgi:uncharacterized protein
LTPRLTPAVVESEPGAVSQGALLLVGFPTFGLVGSIVAGYLVTALGMRQVGSVDVSAFAPSVIVEDGRARAPVRLFAGPVVCGPAGRCDQLVVIDADLQPPPFLLVPMADAILAWAHEREIALAIAVEGFPVDTASHDEPKVLGMATETALDTLKFLKVPRVTGVSTGFAAALLLAGMGAGSRVPVMCAVTEAHPDHPDAIAAAKVIEILHPLFPSLDIDTAPLRATAESLEQRMRTRLAEQSNSLDRLAESGSVSMYG